MDLQVPTADVAGLEGVPEVRNEATGAAEEG
jgi:hypothetical protein